MKLMIIMAIGCYVSALLLMIFDMVREIRKVRAENREFEKARRYVEKRRLEGVMPTPFTIWSDAGVRMYVAEAVYEEYVEMDV